MMNRLEWKHRKYMSVCVCVTCIRRLCLFTNIHVATISSGKRQTYHDNATRMVMAYSIQLIGLIISLLLRLASYAAVPANNNVTPSISDIYHTLS